MTCSTCGGSGLMYPHPDALVALNCGECGGDGVIKAAVDAADLTKTGDLDKRIAALPPATRLRVVAQATDPDRLEQLVTEAERRDQ